MTKAVKKTEKTICEVKEVEFDVFGYLGDSEVYTPAIFEEKNVPKNKRYSVTIEPMNDDDCTTIRALNRQEMTQFQLWLSDNTESVKANTKWLASTKDKKITLTEKEMALISEMIQKREHFSTNSQKFKIVRNYISDLSKPHPNAGDGLIDLKVWERMPKAIKADIYNRIYDISMMSNSDAINLQ